MRRILRLLLVLTVLAAVAWAGLLASGRQLGDLAWGRAELVEGFADGAWRTRWLIADGAFDRRDGTLVSTAPREATLVLRQPIAGPVAIEFTGRIDPGARPGDLSVVWYDELELSADDSRVLGGKLGWKLQVGAYDNAYSCILDPEGRHVAYSDFRLEAGRTYRIRAELDDTRLRLLVDGRTICEHRSLFPIGSGHLALYAYYAGKVFSDVRLFRRPVGQMVPATAVADHLARQRQYGPAAEEYARVAAAIPGTTLAGEALLRRALCVERGSGALRAEAAWNEVLPTAHRDLAILAALDRRFIAKDHAAVLAGLRDLVRTCRDEQRPAIALRWAAWVEQLSAAGTGATVLDGYRAVHEACLADQTAVDRTAADLYLRLRRPEEVLTRFPHQRAMCVGALRQMGRAEEALRTYRDQPVATFGLYADLNRVEDGLREGPPWAAPMILLASGQYERVLADYPNETVWCALARMNTRRFQEVLDTAPEHLTGIRAEALFGLGREEEALAQAVLAGDPFTMYLRLGRLDDAAPLVNDDPVRRIDLDHHRGLEAWKAGDRAAAERLFALPFPHVYDLDFLAWNHFVLIPFLHALAGDKAGATAELERTLRDHGGQYRGQLGRDISVLLGKADEGDEMPPGRRLLAGMAGEFAGGEAAVAVDHYRAFIAGDRLAQPLARRFAAWRVEALTAAP